jgi:predicted nuclease of restriction endonuclease-like (RecB) superfamily
MKQFFETYRDQPKLAALLRELSWSHNLAIMSRCKRDEEREFYLRLAAQERWALRELQRQLAGALFERVVLSPTKLSPPPKLHEFYQLAREQAALPEVTPGVDHEEEAGEATQAVKFRLFDPFGDRAGPSGFSANVR